MGSDEAIVQAVVVVDREGVVRHWSPGAEALIGHPRDVVVGRSLDVIVPPEYRERHWAGFRDAMRTSRARAEGSAAAIPVLHADGVVRRLPGRFALFRDAQGRAAGAVGVFLPPDGGVSGLFEL